MIKPIYIKYQKGGGQVPACGVLILYNFRDFKGGVLCVRVALGMAVASVTLLYVYLITVGRNITDQNRYIYSILLYSKYIDVSDLPPVHTPASVEVWSTSSRDKAVCRLIRQFNYKTLI